MENSKPETDAHGTTRWYYSGRRHRVDGPAIEYANGNKTWYSYGQIHRLDGPAVLTTFSGDEFWFIHSAVIVEGGGVSGALPFSILVDII